MSHVEKKEEQLLPGAVVAASVAAEDVKKWLDHKRVKPIKREIQIYYINQLVQAVMYGDLVLNEDFTFTHKLNVPVVNGKDGSSIFDKLTYASRLTVQDVSNVLEGMNTRNEISNSIAYGAALTGKATGLIGRLDTSDLEVMTAVGIFFT
jgi:hypothetical protein